MQFDEPEATGGVPILKYKAEWKSLGEEAWHFKWYDAKEGESSTYRRDLRTFADHVGRGTGRMSPSTIPSSFLRN